MALNLNREGVALDGDARNKRNENWGMIEGEVQNYQGQIDQLVLDGDSSPEAAQARVAVDGTSHTTLKARLDAEEVVTAQRLAETDARLIEISADKQQAPVQYYGLSKVYIDYPGTAYNVAGDPSFADDRTGATGKLWMFYFQGNTTGLVRREVPYVGCKPSELGAPTYVTTIGSGRVNNFVLVDGIWYCGAGSKIFKFENGIQNEPVLIRQISAVGSNGDQSFVANATINKDKVTGTWYIWYATFDGTNTGIRRATAATADGTYTIEPGFWMTPQNIDASLNWFRVYYIMTDKWGKMWAVAGCGRTWGGVGQPDHDDWAEVWVSPISTFTEKPTQWKRVASPPYFNEVPYGSPFINNAYAPAFIQEGDEWYLYVNTGVYGTERIVELRPNFSESWTKKSTDTSDIKLTSVYQKPDAARAFIRDGKFKISIAGALLNNFGSAQWHSVNLQLYDEVTGELFLNQVIQNGAFAWESRAFQFSTVVGATTSKTLRLQCKYSTGSGQVVPTDSRIRGLSLSVEHLN